MSIRVVCPNGHKLNVNDSLAGKVGLCPTCKARVRVPLPKEEGLSEDAIMNILGPYPPSPIDEEAAGGESDNPYVSVHSKGLPPKKFCDNCNQEILAGTHICPHCHTYIAQLSDF